MFLKKILLCTLVAMVLAPVCAFAKGPHFSLSLNMFVPPRACIVRPCPPPPPPVIVYPYYVYPYYYPCHHCWVPPGHIGNSLGR